MPTAPHVPNTPEPGRKYGPLPTGPSAPVSAVKKPKPEKVKK